MLLISVCKLFNAKSSAETVSRKTMNNFKDPPRLICSPASSMLLLVMKIADLWVLPGCWKSDLEAVSPQPRETEVVPALLEQLHSFLAGAMLVFHLTGAEKIFSVYE